MRISISRRCVRVHVTLSQQICKMCDYNIIKRGAWAEAEKDTDCQDGAQRAMDQKKFNEDRRRQIPFYLLQLCLAVTITVTVLYGGYYYCDYIPVPRSNEFSEKLLYTLRYCTFPQAIFVMVAIFRVGSKRGSSPAMNPLSGNEQYVQTEKNVLMNTVEQLLCFLLFMLALTTYLEPLEMRIVPLCSLAFIIGRFLFMIGYSFSPKYRSTGMSVNFFVSFFCIGYIIYLIYTRGFMYGTFANTSTPTSDAAGKTEL